jgi:hypothetical protein
MTYNPSDIFTQTDLSKLTKSGIINEDIILRGEHLKVLNNVEKIKGFLGISDSNLESLGDLKEITGDFWISSHTVFSRLTSLRELEKVGGNLNLRYSNVIDLSALKEVGGNLSLRDTSIEDISNLTHVGGDLYLPKRLQDKLDISKITVNGKVRYWNDNKTKKNIIPKEELGLITYSSEVPHWKHQYVFSIRDLENATYEQQQFYKIYKNKFKNGVFLDIEGNDNYSFILYYDLLDEDSQHENMQELQRHFENLEKHYPKTKVYTQSAVIEKMESHENYESAWKLKYSEQYIGIQTIIEYEQRLKRSLLDGELMVKLAGFGHLTEFGQKNIENIKPFIDKQLEAYVMDKKMKFFELFFQIGKLDQTSKKLILSEKNGTFEILRKAKKELPKSNYDAEYYKQFYLSEAEYNHYKRIDSSQVHINKHSDMTHVVEKAILNQFRLILKQAEDLYRESTGMPKIGEGWISETELYYKITEAFQEHEVIHHGSPNWLGRQHLDIYFPKVNIGIEYQGAQHYVAVDFFGGEEALEKTKERDERKRLKCNENDCSLIYVDEGYDFEDVRKKIKEILNNSVQHHL